MFVLDCFGDHDSWTWLEGIFDLWFIWDLTNHHINHTLCLLGSTYIEVTTYCTCSFGLLQLEFVLLRMVFRICINTCQIWVDCLFPNHHYQYPYKSIEDITCAKGDASFSLTQKTDSCHFPPWPPVQNIPGLCCRRRLEPNILGWLEDIQHLIWIIGLGCQYMLIAILILGCLSRLKTFMKSRDMFLH